MGTDASFANWTLLYTAELLSFSLVLLFLVRSELQRPIIYWIGSNLLAALGMLMPSSFVTTSSAQVSQLSFFFSATSNILVYFAMNYRQGTSRPRIAVFCLVLLLWSVSALMPLDKARFLVAYAGGVILILLSGWAAYRNPLWRGMVGYSLLLIGFLISAALISWRAVVPYTYPGNDGFGVKVEDAAFGMQVLVFASFLMQISFVSLVIGRDLRRRRVKDRLAAREFEMNRAIAEEQQQMEKLADERLDMISLLTHDVRQPINNAQAALEALVSEVKVSDTRGGETREAIARAQAVLDGITLSISNAILGVSLIDRNYAIHTRPIDVREIAELAHSDCPAEQRHRIRIDNMANTIFADMDPVLIRLALRNLFDNALKYSRPHSLVRLGIIQDAERLGVSFQVTNEVSDHSILSEDIFGHRVRGTAAPVEGSGHGLYLVKKVADAHYGNISFTVSDGRLVTFDLFIPD